MPFSITNIQHSHNSSDAVYYTIDTQSRTYEAEIRDLGGQVDWSDDFQDLLIECSKQQADWNRISQAIMAVHEGRLVEFPIIIGS